MKLLHKRPLEKSNPATGEVLAQYITASALDIEEKIMAAAAAQRLWSGVRLTKRARMLHWVADEILRNQDDLARLISEETGKPLRESYEAELLTAVSLLRYYANISPGLLDEALLPPDKSWMMGRFAFRRRIPKGILAVITPWNYPFAIPASLLAAGLAAGNAIVFKPSELAPGVGDVLVQLFQRGFRRAGFAPAMADILQIVQGDGEVGAALVEADGINHILFTGGAVTGERIREAASHRGISCTLELGGSDPAIVLDSATDMDTIASTILWGRCVNAGQSCSAVKRLIVHESLQDALTQLLKVKMESLTVGNPLKGNYHMGPLINETQLNRTLALVEDACHRGATLVTGGVRLAMESGGWFMAPTLLENVPPDARLLQEEAFGPVLPILTFRRDSEAISLANGTPFGLGAAVFGESRHAQRIAGLLEAGVVAVNDLPLTSYAVPSAAWVGHKQSGIGMSHGEEGLLETTRTQIIMRNWGDMLGMFAKPPWFYEKKLKDAPDLSLSKAMLNSFGKKRPWTSLLGQLRLTRLLMKAGSKTRL